MTEFDIHVLLMCIMVFILLVSVSTVLLVVIYKQMVKLIQLGAYDEKIKIEHDKLTTKKNDKVQNIISIIVEIILWCVLIAILVTNFTIGINRNTLVGEGGVIKTVESTSMSYANPRNTYLKDNNLTTQVNTDDLIRLEKLPAEEDIKIYDVIMYENSANNTLILHRIVHMYNATNEKGETVRYYILRGDAVPNDDGNIVTYEDMRGIYRGEHIGKIGSFVRFMHSPAGYLCLSLAMVLLVAIPILDSRISKIKKSRLEIIDYIV